MPPNPTGKGLKPAKPGEVRNPAGKAKGTLNMSTRIRRILDRSIDWDRINVKQIEGLKNRYGELAYADAMIYIQISKALVGDTKAFKALVESGYGKTINLGGEAHVEVVHIFKPDKLEIAQIEQKAAALRERAHKAVEAEVLDEVDSPARPADIRPINT